jgi:hypothetical protein
MQLLLGNTQGELMNETRHPDCDVCGWATAYHYAYDLNLCKYDLEIVNKVAQATEDHIIKLLTTDSIERLGFYGEKILLSPLEAHRGSDSDIDDEQVIALIKGEQPVGNTDKLGE